MRALQLLTEVSIRTLMIKFINPKIFPINRLESLLVRVVLLSQSILGMRRWWSPLGISLRQIQQARVRSIIFYHWMIQKQRKYRNQMPIKKEKITVKLIKHNYRKNLVMKNSSMILLGWKWLSWSISEIWKESQICKELTSLTMSNFVTCTSRKSFSLRKQNGSLKTKCFHHLERSL